MKTKPPADVNKLAAFVVGKATREGGATLSEKRAEAGSKGGQVRAASLTPEQRQDIARKGVDARKK